MMPGAVWLPMEVDVSFDGSGRDVEEAIFRMVDLYIWGLRQARERPGQVSVGQQVMILDFPF
jgi:hypothetical protein